MTFAGPIEFTPQEVALVLGVMLALFLTLLAVAGSIAWLAAGGGRGAFLLGVAVSAPVAWLTRGTGQSLLIGCLAAAAAGLALRASRPGDPPR